MRLAIKLAGAVTAGVTLVLTAQGLFSVKRNEHLYELQSSTDFVTDARKLIENEYFSAILWTQVFTTIVVAILCSLVTFALGYWLVGRPIRRLIKFADRLTAGDYTAPSDLENSGEVGELGRALSAMAARLDQTQNQVRDERRERTKALEELRHADRLSTVGRIASSVAHELGTPLNVVLGRAGMISADESLPAEVRENADIVAEQADRMTQIIRGILDFSRSRQLDRKQVRVAEVLEQACSLLQPIADERNITFEIHGELDRCAQVDQGRILQVGTNLIGNAIDAMPKGGKITLNVQHKHIAEPKEQHAAPGNFVCITIKDEGLGISKDKFKDIFKPFFTARQDGSGTGLGLSVCQGIVSEHKGWIDVQSEVGKGSSFTVCLPEVEAT